MSRETRVRTQRAENGDVELWTILTHPAEGEWWSEVLDPHRHPHVRHDEFGYDTVEKYYGDTVEESVQEALKVLSSLVEEKGGLVEQVGKTEEI